jgi:hypothetical protein
MAALTAADVARLRAKLDAGDRAGFYLLYHDLTGSNEALTQAEVSSFSGELARQAMDANAAIRGYLWLTGRGNQYPGTVESFSQIIANDLYKRIADSVAEGETGIFRDRDIFDFAKERWRKQDIGDCFPGNLLDLFRGEWPGLCSLIGAGGGAAQTLEAIDPPQPPAIPSGGRQLTTADGQATYIIDSRGMVVPVPC